MKFLLFFPGVISKSNEFMHYISKYFCSFKLAHELYIYMERERCFFKKSISHLSSSSSLLLLLRILDKNQQWKFTCSRKRVFIVCLSLSLSHDDSKCLLKKFHWFSLDFIVVQYKIVC